MKRYWITVGGIDDRAQMAFDTKKEADRDCENDDRADKVVEVITADSYVPKGTDVNDWDSVEAHIAASVTCSCWLEGKGLHDLALAHRDEFIKEWYLDAEHWDTKVFEMIDWVQRKGDTPEVSTEQLLAIRITEKFYNDEFPDGLDGKE